MLRLFFLLLFSPAVLAAPLQLAHQGRLSDGDDTPLEGTHELVFSLHDSASGGNVVWTETISAEFNSGHYSVVLGADVTANALESDWFQDSGLFLSLSVDGGEPLEPRHALLSVPHAISTEVATRVDGGTVNAEQVSIAGTPVIDSSGEWVGPAIEASSDWSDLENVPSGFADNVDDDSLGALACLSGSIPEWDATAAQWVCGVDDSDSLTEAEVETYVVNGALDLNSGTTLGGAAIATGTHTVDTDTQLTEAEVETYVVNGALDLDSGTTLGGAAISTGSHTADTQLSETDVEGYITNGAVDLDSGTTLGGAAISTGTHTVDTQLSETDVEGYITNGAVDLDAGTTLGGAAISTGDHTGGIPSGAVMPFAGSVVPSGWLLCDGAAVSKTTYADLFAAIGITYGDSGTDFLLPDLSSRVPVGLGASGTFTTLGATGGAETHTLTESEMPSHYHTWTASRQLAGRDDDNNTSELSHGDRSSGNTMTKDTDSKGGDAAHNNMQPYVVLNYIIKE